MAWPVGIDPQVDEQRHDRREDEEHEPVADPGPPWGAPRTAASGIDQPWSLVHGSSDGARERRGGDRGALAT